MIVHQISFGQRRDLLIFLVLTPSLPG